MIASWQLNTTKVVVQNCNFCVIDRIPRVEHTAASSGRGGILESPRMRRARFVTRSRSLSCRNQGPQHVWFVNFRQGRNGNLFRRNTAQG